jgi:hypothetical protein
VLLIGDFNSNAIWDDKHRRAVSHSDIVTWLAERDIVSLYHEQSGILTVVSQALLCSVSGVVGHMRLRTGPDNLARRFPRSRAGSG